jgi:pimeloyl-ACP methyl ester carboxylesterase
MIRMWLVTHGSRGLTRQAQQLLCRLAAFGVAFLVICHALENRAHGETPSPSFTDTACALPHLTPRIRPRLRCGVVDVPRDYAHPQAGQFKLAVVVIRADRQPPASEPVVYLSGGPGGPLTTFTSYQAEHPLVDGRDIILVDQRGTGHSEPSLCPSLAGRFAAALVEAAIEPAAEARRRALFAACRTQAMAQGIDLADFGTSVTVADFDRVRQALGIARWNLFGVSYGTTIAMTLMALHPRTVRSAVLDSINPPDPMLPPWSANVTDAVRAFLASCQADAGCGALYPDRGPAPNHALVLPAAARRAWDYRPWAAHRRAVQVGGWSPGISAALLPGSAAPDRAGSRREHFGLRGCDRRPHRSRGGPRHRDKLSGQCRRRLSRPAPLS